MIFVTFIKLDMVNGIKSIKEEREILVWKFGK